jgi:hypothetical protein
MIFSDSQSNFGIHKAPWETKSSTTVSISWMGKMDAQCAECMGKSLSICPSHSRCRSSLSSSYWEMMGPGLALGSSEGEWVRSGCVAFYQSFTEVWWSCFSLSSKSYCVLILFRFERQMVLIYCFLCSTMLFYLFISPYTDHLNTYIVFSAAALC